MHYIGDFLEDTTDIVIFFHTSDGSGAAVAPSSAYENSDIKIFKGNSATQKTSTNGITMTSPFDSRTGIHCIKIDTSNDTGDAGFWVAGEDYTVILDADETVDGQNVHAVLAQFSIENRSTSQIDTNVSAIKTETDKFVFTIANRLDVHVISCATNSLTADAAATDFIGATEIAAGASQEIADLIAADWVAGDASPLAIVAALKADSEWSNLATMQADITGLPSADDMWTAATRELTSATNITSDGAAINSSAGIVQSNVKQIADDATAATNASNLYKSITTGTAQAGAASSITLAADESGTDDIYNKMAIFIVSGTGAEQTNKITAYNGTTKVATVQDPWEVTPDNTSVYQILGRIG